MLRVAHSLPYRMRQSDSLLSFEASWGVIRTPTIWTAMEEVTRIYRIRFSMHAVLVFYPPIHPHKLESHSFQNEQTKEGLWLGAGCSRLIRKSRLLLEGALSKLSARFDYIKQEAQGRSQHINKLTKQQFAHQQTRSHHTLGMRNHIEEPSQILDNTGS